ncbi:Cutinase [Cyphellophora attinorum]|uniref:Cutinase n=1 Tax=Cyphellophora attinorum TaxID=1664694 RepID=A0A0N1I1G7_9EURO|nr:Cutinase [Phialophora attinorum]KPI45703.1 Cutinase [Phialophora attinorum]
MPNPNFAIFLTLLGLAWSLPTPAPAAEPSHAEGAVNLEARGLYDIVQNGLSGPCTPVTIVFARGTAEPGNVGLLAGPPFFGALGNLIGSGNIAIQGVDYPASIPGYLVGGSPDGSTKFAQLVSQAATQCPQTQIVVGGYSQGAQVVHNGLKQTPANVAARINAAVLFGDPYDGQALQGVSADDTVTYCFDDDLICKGDPIVLPAHLSYSLDAGSAAAFVAGKVQV